MNRNPNIYSVLDTRNTRGFTIVELLIAIIVIAILASISVVAYNGIQQKANEASLSSTINQYAKLFELYAVDNGTFPTTQWSCLGSPSDYPEENGYQELHCGKGTHHYYKESTYNQSIIDAISAYGTPPKTARYLEAPDERGGELRGLLYDSRAQGTKLAGITYFLKGNRSCPIGKKIYFNSLYNSTRCVYEMSAGADS